ncbi:pirin family protein [Aestuariibius sp. HNIBRBA575]|uniref:pirin family protein n=1 Tax=Aestuariibius sp. HNIBRBA575 TaxID=3233343 RepID=UPI0034A14636
MTLRPIAQTMIGQPTIEGAGVKLDRLFGFGDSSLTDPFLLMDHFGSDNPADFQKGFPWHPHRGIETITYVLDGEVEHQDSLGNTGVLGAGSVQWMTAGSGIMHQEMPRGNAAGAMHGFQLWANLPAHLKMTDPRYQDIGAADLPIEGEEDGSTAKIITGEFWGKTGPVDGVAANPLIVDISIPAGRHKVIPVDTRANAMAYVFAGSGSFANASAPVGIQVEKEFNGQELSFQDLTGERTLVRFDAGDEISVQAGPEGMRFLLITGRPIREPVAWHGPIVMNSKAELMQAIKELRQGTFIKDTR